MSATASPTQAFPQGRRKAPIAALVLAPTVMLASSIAGAADIDSAERVFDLLTVPALFAWGVVILLATRSWSRRWAWTALVALVLQATALAAVTGMGILQDALVSSGISEDAIDAAMDDGIMQSPAGALMFIWFMPVLVIGIIAAAVALLRTRPISKIAGVCVLLLMVTDIGLPEDPAALRVLPFVFMLGAGVTIAVAIARTGVPTRGVTGETAPDGPPELSGVPADAAATF